MLWKRIALLQRSRLTPVSTALSAKSNGSRRELASSFDGECLEKTGHIQASVLQKSLKRSAFRSREALHASWLSVSSPKLTSQQHESAYPSFQPIGASHWKMQNIPSRSYHKSRAALQTPDVLVPPPEKKRMQETGDRNVDIFDRDLKTKHVSWHPFLHGPTLVALSSVLLNTCIWLYVDVCCCKR